jgi:hypothetical protein
VYTVDRIEFIFIYITEFSAIFNTSKSARNILAGCQLAALHLTVTSIVHHPKSCAPRRRGSHCFSLPPFLAALALFTRVAAARP